MERHGKRVKAEDGVEISGPRPALELERLKGTWINTDELSRGMAKVVVDEDSGKLFVRIFGGSDAAASDWGRVEADTLYADSISSCYASAFAACYRLQGVDMEIQANWNQGLLVVGSFGAFTDGSNRSDYFTREFFRQQRD
jgi:hypothetical protein